MPQFTHSSANKMQTCDDRLITLFKEVIKYYDFIVMCGYRNEKDQNAAVAAGNSKTPWPKSKHNAMPSQAVDVLPTCLIVDGKINWDNKAAFSELAEIVFREADKLGIHIRWGGDFNQDGSKTTNDSWDLPHFELAYPMVF